MRFGLDLTVDQILLVDVAAHTVELADGPSRRHTMTGAWLTLAPGASTLVFLAAAYSSEASLVASWRDTYA